MGTELYVNQKKISLNTFVEKILQGMIVGAVTSLRGIDEEWKAIEIKVKKE